MGVEHLPLFEDVDIIQVGAQHAELTSCASSAKLRKPILLKRGLASTLHELLMSAEYIMAGGNEQVGSLPSAASARSTITPATRST